MIRRRKKAGGKMAYLVSVGDSPTRSFDRYDDAEEYERDLKRSRKRTRNNMERAEKPNVTFAALVALWEDNFSPSAWRLDMVAYVTARWGKVKVRDIEAEAFGAWLLTLKGRKGEPLAQKTKAHVLESARQVFNAGVKWDYLLSSPAAPGNFKAPSSRKSRVRPIMPFESWDEVMKVADAAAADWTTSGPLIRFVCATGLRPVEWRELQWKDVDLRGRTLITGSKTAAGQRSVPLSARAIEALEELPTRLGPVFVGKLGKGRIGYKNWRAVDWPLALSSAGFAHRTPYEMRHTFATLALAHGASIDDVATVMGHEHISVAYDYYRKWIKTAADRLLGILDTIDTEDSCTESSSK